MSKKLKAIEERVRGKKSCKKLGFEKIPAAVTVTLSAYTVTTRADHLFWVAFTHLPPSLLYFDLYMSFTLNNKRFGKDLQRFVVRTPPTTTPEGLPFGLSPNDPPHTSNYTINLDESEVGKGRIGRVFRGVMRGDSSTSIEHVVVKLVAPATKLVMKDGKRHSVYHSSQRTAASIEALLGDLAYEALQYAQFLPALQGSVVPRFFGHGVSEDGKAAIMVLEDAGVALTFPYQRLPEEDR